jgi:hypothetical protein
MTVGRQTWDGKSLTPVSDAIYGRSLGIHGGSAESSNPATAQARPVMESVRQALLNALEVDIDDPADLAACRDVRRRQDQRLALVEQQVAEFKNATAMISLGVIGGAAFASVINLLVILLRP